MKYDSRFFKVKVSFWALFKTNFYGRFHMFTKFNLSKFFLKTDERLYMHVPHIIHGTTCTSTLFHPPHPPPPQPPPINWMSRMTVEPGIAPYDLRSVVSQKVLHSTPPIKCIFSIYLFYFIWETGNLFFIIRIISFPACLHIWMRK